MSAAAVELGANGRWRLFTADATGALVPLPPGTENATGRYYALATGQIDVDPEGVIGGESIEFVSFAAGMDALRFDDGEPYARATPSPANGRDNPPSVTDGHCMMVGTWDLPANPVTPVEPAAIISFGTEGSFVAGPRGSDLCASHTMYGTYRLSPGLFQLTSNVGMGLCQWWYDAGYPATFNADCSQVMLMQQYDNCTGGRGYLNGMTTLTRHPNGP